MCYILDVIILTNTANDDYHQMCANTISTLKSSNVELQFNIIIVESNNRSTYVFDCAHYIIMNEEFNYNKFLNVGLQYANHDYHLIINNDLIFHHKSVENMMKVFGDYSDIVSLSPLEPDHHKCFNYPTHGIVFGYQTQAELAGWCILIRRIVIDIIGKFDEHFKFWYQDDDYGKLLEQNKLKHALCLDSRVTHLAAKSHMLLNNEIDMTTNQRMIYTKKWKDLHI